MDPNRRITKKFTNNFDSKVINRQYFHRETGLKSFQRREIKLPQDKCKISLWCFSSLSVVEG